MFCKEPALFRRESIFFTRSRMAAVRAGSFFDAVRFSGPVRFAGPVRFTRFAGSRGLPVHAVRFTRFGQWWQKLSRSIKTETITKIVPVRAVDLSIGPFCTEFRCERFRDDAVFRKSLKIWPVRVGSVLPVRRFVAVRFMPVRF